MGSVKLTRGTYEFRDLSTGKLHKVKSDSASNAIKKLNAKLGKKVNFSFLGFNK